MSQIKNNGVPTRTTCGALGDIYTDTDTGNMFKCTGSYSMNGQSEYEWKAIGRGAAKKAETVAPTKKSEVEKKETPVAEKKEKTVEKKEETPNQVKGEKTNYGQYYKGK